MPPHSPSEMFTRQPRTVKKLDAVVATLEKCYDTMAELQAEGQCNSFTPELLVSSPV